MDINKFVEIYTNTKDTLSFDFGVIIAEDKDGLVILSFSNNGTYDSTEYIENSGIYLREYGDEYCKSMSSKIMKEDINEHYIELIGDVSLKEQFLKYCMENNLLTSLELYNSNCVDVYGSISSVEKGSVTINKIGDNDNSDGYASVLISAITRIGI